MQFVPFPDIKNLKISAKAEDWKREEIKGTYLSLAYQRPLLASGPPGSSSQKNVFKKDLNEVMCWKRDLFTGIYNCCVALGEAHHHVYVCANTDLTGVRFCWFSSELLRTIRWIFLFFLFLNVRKRETRPGAAQNVRISPHLRVTF